MFDAHPPFQIDGNFGGTSGIAEMFLQSRVGFDGPQMTAEIELLPALPEAFSTGSVKGLRAKGGFEIDLEWSEGRLVLATIRSQAGSPCRLRCGDALLSASLERAGTLRWDGR
jgi:alpha-L-fucosidase 2